MATDGYSWPFKGDITITSPYGYRDPSIGSGAFHQGIDMVETGKSGGTIYCIHSGVVTISADVVPGWEPAGSMIIIKGTDGKFVTYEEFKPASMQVKVGEHVKAGAPLATMGVSGNTTGEHLHLGINDTGLAPLDPSKWNDPAPFLGIKNQTGTFKKPPNIGNAGDTNQGGDGGGETPSTDSGTGIIMFNKVGG